MPRKAIEWRHNPAAQVPAWGQALEIAENGLTQRVVLDGSGVNETPFLDDLHEIVAGGPCPAEGLLEAYRSSWGENIDELFSDIAY